MKKLLKPRGNLKMRTLRIWTGPVASEKTTKALYAAKRLMRRGYDLVLVRPPCSKRKHETEHEGFLVTKSGERWPCIEIKSALEIEDAADGADAIWLDEPFMFEDQRKLYKAVRRVLKTTDVLISTISATSEMEPISPSISALLAIADEIHHCRADCDDCQRLSNASRSWHLSGPKTEKVKTGGEESYEPKCPRCWYERLEAQQKTAQVNT
jgi:thymidine kinase